MNFLFGDNVSTEDEGYLLFSKAFTRVSEIATRRIRMSVSTIVMFIKVLEIMLIHAEALIGVYLNLDASQWKSQ